jgi:hypothetical protein
MVELLVDGWAQPQATSVASASQLRVRIAVVVIERKTRGAHVFDPVMIRDVYHHAS